MTHNPKHPCEFCEVIILATWFLAIVVSIWLTSMTGASFDRLPNG